MHLAALETEILLQGTGYEKGNVNTNFSHHNTAQSDGQVLLAKIDQVHHPSHSLPESAFRKVTYRGEAATCTQ